MTAREVVNGKVGEMQCYEMDILGMYLTRAFNDSKGPKKIRIYAEQNLVARPNLQVVCRLRPGRVIRSRVSSFRAAV